MTCARRCAPAAAPLSGIGLISAMMNVLYLTGSFFMLEVYDRVLPSRSVPTLVGLACWSLGLYLFQGVLDIPARARPRAHRRARSTRR